MEDIKSVRRDLRGLEWTAPEFEEFDKGPGWYWLSLLFAILIVFFCGLAGEFSFWSFCGAGGNYDNLLGKQEAERGSFSAY